MCPRCCRMRHLIDNKVPAVLATCAGADSERTREFIARSYLGLLSVEEGAHCGAVVAMGGTRSLLNLFNDNTGELLFHITQYI